MYPSSSNNLNRETDDAIYFFTPAFHPLDNFSAHIIKLWGKFFMTAEHAYQWKKFEITQPDIAEKIFRAPSPHAVKKISDSFKDKTSKSWDKEKISAMEEILRAKANQHEDVREILKRTENRTIYENSPVDSFWGTGPDNNGQNIIGKLWMQIREEI